MSAPLDQTSLVLMGADSLSSTDDNNAIDVDMLITMRAETLECRSNMSALLSPGVRFIPFEAGEDMAALLTRTGQTAYSNIAVFDCANFKEVLLEGWSAIEEGYVWSCQTEALLGFKIPANDSQHSIRLIANSFRLPGKLSSQRALIFVNDVELGEITIDALGVIDCCLPKLAQSGEAIIRLTLPDARRPRDLTGGNSDERLLGLSIRRIVVCETPLTETVGTPVKSFKPEPPLSDVQKSEIMSRFESLGENCEFGLVQRRCGAEPLGLLRFSSAPLPKLLAALQARFAGMGAPENIEVELSSNEYMVRDRAFGFYYHAWVKEGEMTPEQIRAREKSRVPFLLRKLIEDLSEGRKIFVFHAMEEISTVSAQMLSAAIQSYGTGKLLWVRLADRYHPAGFIELQNDNLIVGYIDRFAPGGNAHDLSLDCWVVLCRNTLAMIS
jgi:hypothetical protein